MKAHHAQWHLLSIMLTSSYAYDIGFGACVLWRWGLSESMFSVPIPGCLFKHVTSHVVAQVAFRHKRRSQVLYVSSAKGFDKKQHSAVSEPYENFYVRVHT